MLVGQHRGQKIRRRVQGIEQGGRHGPRLREEPPGNAVHQAARARHPQGVEQLQGKKPLPKQADYQGLIGGEARLVGPVVEVLVLQIIPAAPGHLASGVIHGLEILHRLGAEHQDDPQGNEKPQGTQGQGIGLCRL